MNHKLLNRPLRTAILAMVLAGQAAIPTLSFAATGWNDPQFLQEKAELLMARATGAQAQQSAIDSRDAAALSSAECTAISTSARDAATAYVSRGQPISPETVIQNSTCFLDVMDIKIPVSMTGIGFLDSIIGSLMSKLMSSACSKSMSFINDLKNSAVNQLTSGINGALKMDSLSIAGVNVSGAVNGAVSGQVNGAINGVANGTSPVFGGTAVISNSTNGNLFSAGPTSSNLFQSSGTTAGFP